ncbi:MAG: Zn-ribbon domain-containing OB-fold protein [Candidatus Bathyarchaeota archaeon]|nr:Zn-ribbon domain-containing OB-fold protein [Candidatus Bathyarchaeota archaeon]
MSESHPFTVSSFYLFIKEKRLMAAKCSKCGTIVLPPKPMCTKCFCTDIEWIELNGTGKLLSYTVIHVAPEQFQSMVPYCVGIVEFNDGLRLPGIIKDIQPEQLKVGMELKTDFECEPSSTWPCWTRYYFKPV